MSKTMKRVTAMLLALLLVVTGIGAYFTSSDTKSDSYTIGQIEVEVVGDDDLYKAEKLTPNYEYEFTRSVHNIGINDAYVFLAVTVPFDEVYTHDLDGNQVEADESELKDVQLFTWGTNNAVGVSSDWKPVTAGKFGDYDIQQINGAIKNTSGEYAAIRVNNTITYIYGYVGDGDTLARLAPDETTASIFDTMKFANISDTVDKYNIEETAGKIITQVYAIQADNVLETEYMTGNNDDGSEAINAVWKVLNTATNDKALSSTDMTNGPSDDEDEGEGDDVVVTGSGTITFSLIDSATDAGIPNVTMQLVQKSTGKVVRTVVSDANGAGEFSDLPVGNYKITSPNFELTDDANNLSIVDENGTDSYEFYGDMSWAGTLSATVYSEATGRVLGSSLIEIYNRQNQVVATLKADNTGKFSAYPLKAGEYYVLINGIVGYDDAYNKSFEVIGGQTTDTVLYQELTNVLKGDGEFTPLVNADTTSITFTSRAVPEATSTTDFSARKDKSLLGWYEGTDLYITAVDGGTIYANNDSDALFKNLTALERVDFDNLDTTKIVTCYNMFLGCSSLTDVDFDNLKLPRVGDISGMFYGCTSLKDVDLKNFTSPYIVNIQSMFYGCTSLETLDMSYINTTKVTNMSNVFNGCTNLKTLNVEGFDLSSAGQTYGMFKNCSSLEVLDLSTWKITQRINDMSEMFRDCTNLKTIYATDWYGLVGNAPYDSNMFWGCTSLVGDIEYASNKTGSWYATTNGGYFTEKTTDEEAEYNVEISVFDFKGRSVSGAQILLMNATTGDMAFADGYKAADANGQLFVTLEEGNYVGMVVMPANSEYPQMRNLRSTEGEGFRFTVVDGEIAQVNVQEVEMKAVIITVLDQEGNPVAGARGTVGSTVDGGMSLYTDANGISMIYRPVSEIADGAYIVSITQGANGVVLDEADYGITNMTISGEISSATVTLGVQDAE